MSAVAHGTRIAVLAGALLAWAALGACTPREPTELLLRIHTDLPAEEMPAYDLTVAWADACGRRAVFQACYERTGDAGGHCPAPDVRAGSTGSCVDGTRFDPGPFRRDPLRPSATDGQWEVSHGIVPARGNEPGADLSRPVVIVARGFVGGRPIVTTGEVFASFDRDHLRYVDVYLFRHCVGVDCPAGQVCTASASCGQGDAGAPPVDASDAVSPDATDAAPPTCSDVAVCTPGAQRCTAGVAQRCTLDGTGCPQWTMVAMCDRAMCDLTGTACCDLTRTCAGRHCGVDGCGRPCGMCPTGQTCVASTGQCACADGTAPCAGRCCPVGAVCSPDGTGCACPAGGTPCGSTCCSAAQTCQTASMTCCTRTCGPFSNCEADGCGGFCGCDPYATACDIVPPGDVACGCATMAALCPPPSVATPMTCCPSFQRCVLSSSAGGYVCR